MGKRILSILLAAVLLLSVFAALPTTVGAADTDAAGTGDVISYFEVINLDEPVPGQKPDYTVSVPAGAHYTVGYVEWREKDESADLDPIFINDTFKSNKRYTVRICLNADSGYEFADTETATGSINGKTAWASSYGNSSVAWVERTYTCSFKITSVSVNLDEPVPGQEPDETVSVPAGANYYEDQVLFPEWHLIENGSFADGAWKTFESGKTYHVLLYLHTYPGYEFGDDGENVTATINGKPATVGGWGQRIYVERTYTCGLIDSVSVLDLTEPVAGQTPDYTVSVPAGANYKPSEIEVPEWYHYENGDWRDKLSYNEPFESGKSYLFRIYLRSNSGYDFGDDSKKATAAINGKTATVGGSGDRIWLDRVYTCTANFLSGTVTSFLDSSDKVTLRLDSVTSGGIYKLVDKAVFDVNSAAYQFGGLEKNVKYRLTVSKKNHVTRQYEFKLLFTDSKTLDVKICPIGDADNNGKVNAADAKAAFRHGNEQKLLDDDYKIKCADVASPKNRVNSADAKAIFQHSNEQKSLWTE